jgi:hypothetical protein
MFWVWIAGIVIVIVGASVLIGRSLNKSSARQLSNQEKMTALKASGALRHRKSNRN